MIQYLFVGIRFLQAETDNKNELCVTNQMLVSITILIFSVFVTCLSREGPALNKAFINLG